MKIGSTFSGYGGLDMAAAHVLGGDTAWHCEVDPDASKILEHHWPGTPNHGDITKVDWSKVEPVDVLTGGFPCQDLSHAGKRLGLRPGTRSGLWSHMAYAISELRPRLVVIENVRGLLSAEAHGDLEPCAWCVGDDEGGPLRALGAVLGDLAGLGYDARWAGVRASDAGAPHGRFRVFVVAYPQDDRQAPLEPCGREAELAEPPGGQLLAADAGSGPLAWPAAAGHGLRVPAERGDLAAADAAVERCGPAWRHDGLRPAGLVAGDIAWGPYEPAIRRWEAVLGRVAPPPTEPGAKGQPRLSPRFVEWLMGLPAGHVTDVPISRNAQLKALGNGVVPQQAELALRLLLANVWSAAA